MKENQDIGKSSSAFKRSVGKRVCLFCCWGAKGMVQVPIYQGPINTGLFSFFLSVCFAFLEYYCLWENVFVLGLLTCLGLGNELLMLTPLPQVKGSLATSSSECLKFLWPVNTHLCLPTPTSTWAISCHPPKVQTCLSWHKHNPCSL